LSISTAEAKTGTAWKIAVSVGPSSRLRRWDFGAAMAFMAAFPSGVLGEDVIDEADLASLRCAMM